MIDALKRRIHEVNYEHSGCFAMTRVCCINNLQYEYSGGNYAQARLSLEHEDADRWDIWGPGWRISHASPQLTSV